MVDTPSIPTELPAAHERRLAALDPLLPITHPLPAPAPDGVTLAGDGGLALLRTERPDPESFLASFGAAEQHRLAPRVAGPDPAAAMAGLLDQWRDRMRPQVADHDPETEANLTWPSRDVAMTRLFLGRGLVPAAVIAARLAGRPNPDHPTGIRVRPITADDLDAAADRWLEEVRWDAQFGSATERPSTLGAVRRELTGLVARDQPWTWVTETAAGTTAGTTGGTTGGELTGLVVVSPPDRAEWIANLTCAAPVAYLSCLVVTAGRRGGGVGAALVRQAHAALDAAGVNVTLLHYAALNPLSGPFWHRCGYRPLWTIWHARPASRLR